MDVYNPQEPPPSSAGDRRSSRLKITPETLPTCAYDLYLDLPHPAATTRDRARIVDPPVTISQSLYDEMYDPDNVLRLSRFAFPGYDESGASEASYRARQRGGVTSRGQSVGANLTRHDVYLVDFGACHHTFSLLLADGRTRVHGHVRRYLPPHADAVGRADVGRRQPRAMVLLTRAVGGERFYSSVLKTCEAVALEASCGGMGCFARKKDPVRAFLHALFHAHADLVVRYAELRRHGLCLNFAQTAESSALGRGPSETARAVLEDNEGLFQLALDGTEFGRAGQRQGPAPDAALSAALRGGDALRFYLPVTLQPGFECLPRGPLPEDVACPIIPLLRCIGPSHFVRLLAALLCERRIVLISRSTSRLSRCVRAASSALAQGLLMWRHVLITVVPPHMLRYLGASTPYLVGVLAQFSGRLGKTPGLTDVLCVNLDENELKTLNMADPRHTVPDMLKRAKKSVVPVGGGSSEVVSAAECLAEDLDEIAKADAKLWLTEDEKKRKDGDGSRAFGKSQASASDQSTSLDSAALAEPDSNAGSSSRPAGLLSRIRMRGRSTARSVVSLEERRQYTNSVDAAVAFGRMMRNNFGGGLDEPDGGKDDDLTEADDFEAGLRYSAARDGVGVAEASNVSENEGGEEDVRAALTSFFVHMFGDMGMYLSETAGTFWLDRRKFLLRRKQLGEREQSPIFHVLRTFSYSGMFEAHVRGRIDDMSMTARDRANIMPHHQPLFDVCCKYLSVHRLDFSLVNVRRIVARTVLTCPRHVIVERHVTVRAEAFALTSDTTPYDGDADVAAGELVEACRECNTALAVVMSVVWFRTNQSKGGGGAIVLALRLLSRLLTEGPITAIIEAMDGIGRINSLQKYSTGKNSARVRAAAKDVYALLVDAPGLFVKRRDVAVAAARSRLGETHDASSVPSWKNYLSRRIPPSSNSQNVHALFRPKGTRMFYDGDASVAPSLAPSILALHRMEADARRREEEYDEEEERLFGARDQAFSGYDDEDSSDDRSEDLSARYPNYPMFNGAGGDNGGYDSGAQDPQPSLYNWGSVQDGNIDDNMGDENAAVSDDRSMLDTFNLVVSSHGGGSNSGLTSSFTSNSALSSDLTESQGDPRANKRSSQRMGSLLSMNQFNFERQGGPSNDEGGDMGGGREGAGVEAYDESYGDPHGGPLYDEGGAMDEYGGHGQVV